MNEGSTLKRRRIPALLLGLVLLLAVGCGGSKPVRQEGKSAGAAAPMGAPADHPHPQPQPQPAPKVITAQDALAAVRALPSVAEYEQNAKRAGRRLVVALSDPTPTRFVVMVGDEDATKRTITEWYLVSKSDGTVTLWNMADGPLPED